MTNKTVFTVLNHIEYTKDKSPKQELEECLLHNFPLFPYQAQLSPGHTYWPACSNASKGLLAFRDQILVA